MIIKSFLLLLLMSVNPTKAQTPSSFIGKTYSAEVNASCKAMSDGTCMIYTYCVMEFKENHVRIYYHTKASCTNKSREAGYTHSSEADYSVYTWELKKDKLIIKGFEEYAPFTFINGKLTGTKKINDKSEKLEFREGFE